MAKAKRTRKTIAKSDRHGWINNETLKTRFGNFGFKNGYPVGDAAARLFEIQKLSRAIEVYQTQMMRVSEIALREGMRAFGSKTPQQVVIWENLMDAKTVLLTANTETALRHESSRSEERRTYGDRSAAAHAWLRPGRVAALSGRYWPAGRR
jgi:hypothetical protein